ncbi:MAG: Flp pilus assembly protein CpaB [Euzebyales bacterium]|nr:Flp pilus assembly protein CpaB [Euzebyales bacterium]
MNRRIIGAVAAVLLAAMGTFVLLAYVRSAEDRALAGERVVEVFVTQEAITKGTPVEALGTKVALEKVPAKVRAGSSVDRLDLLEGKVAAVDLVAGEQLLSSRFVAPETLQAQGEIEIPDGLHQVTVSLEPQRALGGQLKPGDTVGVLASFDPFEGDDPPGEQGPPKSPNSTHLILHKVLVTQVQQASAAGAAPPGGSGNQTAQAPSGNLLVTLATKAPSVERLVFTAEHGFVWLSHEPKTAPEKGTSIQTRDTVYE